MQVLPRSPLLRSTFLQLPLPKQVGLLEPLGATLGRCEVGAAAQVALGLAGVTQLGIPEAALVADTHTWLWAGRGSMTGLVALGANGESLLVQGAGVFCPVQCDVVRDPGSGEGENDDRRLAKSATSVDFELSLVNVG